MIPPHGLTSLKVGISQRRRHWQTWLWLVSAPTYRHDAPKAKVKARIVLTPQHAKRFMKALNENIRKFESQNGEIADMEDFPGMNMNFGVPTAQA